VHQIVEYHHCHYSCGIRLRNILDAHTDKEEEIKEAIEILKQSGSVEYASNFARGNTCYCHIKPNLCGASQARILQALLERACTQTRCARFHLNHSLITQPLMMFTLCVKLTRINRNGFKCMEGCRRITKRMSSKGELEKFCGLFDNKGYITTILYYTCGTRSTCNNLFFYIVYTGEKLW